MHDARMRHAFFAQCSWSVGGVRQKTCGSCARAFYILCSGGGGGVHFRSHASTMIPYVNVRTDTRETRKQNTMKNAITFLFSSTLSLSTTYFPSAPL